MCMSSSDDEPGDVHNIDTAAGEEEDKAAFRRVAGLALGLAGT